MGLTGAIVTVNPDSDVMERFVLTYGIENAVETVDNLIGKDVFPDFRLGSLGVVKKGDADRRVYLTLDWFCVYIF